ncbi:unnamed protein product, partial [Musa acuminata subsp. malaccensis]
LRVQKRKEIIGIHVRVQEKPARLRIHGAGFPAKESHQHKKQEHHSPSRSH